nr:response regulator [Blautia massiliensis (ex Durand et al. 2017)]
MEAILEPGGTASGRKLLIVVNDETDRKALTEHLEGSFEVISAMNEAEGMKRLSENYKTLSAILLDMSVPVCDEFQFLELIRDDVMLTSVPVIIITGSNRLEDEVRCLELGAVDFVRKPYNVRILKSKINNVIKLRESVMVLSALEYDDLTGLYIRQAFFHHAKTLMRFNTNQDFHVVVADIKNFKWINGTYGEKTGDQIWRRPVCSHHIWKERDPYDRYGEIYPQGREWSTDS